MLDPDFRSRVAFQKIMTVSMDEDGTVSINHEIINHGTQVRNCPGTDSHDTEWNDDCAECALCSARTSHFLPVRSLILWSYTDMADPRLSL